MRLYQPLGVSLERLRQAAEYFPAIGYILLLVLYGGGCAVLIYMLFVGLPLEHRDTVLPNWVGILLILSCIYFSGLWVIGLIVKRRLARRLREVRAFYDAQSRAKADKGE